jgi:hypothetical protein
MIVLVCMGESGTVAGDTSNPWPVRPISELIKLNEGRNLKKVNKW